MVKPKHLAERGGCWFESGTLKVTLATDPDFRPALRAHPAFVVDDLDNLCDHFTKVGVHVRKASPLEDYAHAFVHDPFGNRIELMEPLANPDGS